MKIPFGTRSVVLWTRILFLSLLLIPFFAGGSESWAIGSPKIPPVLVASATTARPGEPVRITVNTEAHRVVFTTVGGRKLAQAFFFKYPVALSPVVSRSHAGSETKKGATTLQTNNIRVALLAIPSTCPAGNYIIRSEDRSGGLVATTTLVVEKREFLNDLIQLDAGNTRLRTAIDPLKTAESEQLMKILYSFDPSAIWSDSAFMAPVEAQRRTSFFGDRRVYTFADGTTEKSIHAGIDFGVPTGSVVQASARGRVRLARSRIVTGYSIVIEHLPGVFSLYYHLDRIDIHEGDIVEAGTPIGISGSTGLSTGPHLHWELRVAGEAADPDAFIQAPPLRPDHLDNDAFLSKIVG